MFFLCKTSSRPSGSVPSAPSTSLFAETSLGVSLPGSSSSSSSLPLGGQGKRGGVWGAPSVFMGYFLPSRSTLVRREGRWCLWAFVCRVRARSFFSSSFGGWGRGSWLSCCRRPFSRFSSSVDSPQFSPHVPRRGNLGESSVSCSRVLSSRESRSSERGSRVDKRARSREVSSRGRRCRSRSLSSYRSRFSGGERGRRSSSASRSSRGRSCCERSRSSDRCRSQRGGSRSRRAWSRSSDRYRSRRDLSRCARSRSLAAAAPAVSVRVSLPVGGCGAFVRDRTLSRIARLTARGHACDYLLLLPACGPWKQAGWPDVGHRRVWGPLSLSLLWPGAAAGVPPVLEGRPLPLSRLFFPGACQVRHELVWLLFPGSIWSLGGCDRFCSSVVGYRVSRFGCCWGGHFVCCDCDACWGWRFCLLLPLLFLACLVISSVRGSPALAGVAVGCLVMGPTDVLGAL